VDTLKTAVVVVLLLAVLYGVYVVLNKPEQYPQELAWDAQAADPALQIELGTPEATESNPVVADEPPPMMAMGSATTTHDHATDEHSHHAMGDGHSDHDDVAMTPSLPIPDATAVPSIAAPDLLTSTDPPASNFPAQDQLTNGQVTSVEQASNNAPELQAALPLTTATNDLRDPTGAANGVDTPEMRSDSSNRYSGSPGPPSATPVEISATDYTPAPASSMQANVNDQATGDAPVSAENDFPAVMKSVQTKIEAEAWYDALLKLTSYYDGANLSSVESSEIIDLLDPLAGKVIYSTEHLIEPPYQAQPGDTLKNIADRYEVPWQLLANINGIENPEASLAGRELKVVRGPFRAEISLSKNELTLFVGKLYAGRFAVSTGNDPIPVPGQYQVNDKQPGRTYYAGNGQTIPIDDPNNPYGRVWLDLGGNLSIHGSSPNGAPPGQGCIALTARDAGDIYGILSQGSSVVIVR
jgi:LysM repeat protein